MNILEEANKITSGDRQEKYGKPSDNFQLIADVFNALKKTNLSAVDVVDLMIITKLCREEHCHNRDNQTDTAGYAWVKQEIHDSPLISREDIQRAFIFDPRSIVGIDFGSPSGDKTVQYGTIKDQHDNIIGEVKTTTGGEDGKSE